jgi:hypothetical protein
MNTNIILDGFNAMLKQLIASAVADAIKPLQARILALEDGYMDWKGVEHLTAKAMQPLQDRVIALEIQQSMGKAVFTLPDVDFNEAVRNVLDGYNFINRHDVSALIEESIGNLVEEAVEEGISNYDFSEVDMCGAMESAIENYDFSNIVEENMPDQLDKDVVQQMINESLDNLTITRN